MRVYGVNLGGWLRGWGFWGKMWEIRRIKEKKMFKKCISIVLIFCHVFMFVGCYTTKKVYEEIENVIVTTTVLTFVSVDIVSHQNNMGVLYYTVQGKYHNSTTGTFEYIGSDFPLSTYSDAVFYRNENVKEDDFEKEIIRTNTKVEKRKELISSERVFSRGKTMGLIMPIAGVLTFVLLIFAASQIPDQNTQNNY
jgi:hypothetical protein